MKTTRSCRAELPEDTWESLAALAAAEGVSLGTYARRVLTAHTELEPEPRAALAAEARKYGQTPEQRVTYLLTRKYSKP